MANPNGRFWRHARAMNDMPVDFAADRLGIAAGSLRNIETNQPNYSISERLVYRAARLYGVEYADLVTDDDAPKPTPKPRPKDPPAPPPRKDEHKKGPRRGEAA